jgi:hypothetical protein
VTTEWRVDERLTDPRVAHTLSVSKLKNLRPAAASATSHILWVFCYGYNRGVEFLVGKHRNRLYQIRRPDYPSTYVLFMLSCQYNYKYIYRAIPMRWVPQEVVSLSPCVKPTTLCWRRSHTTLIECELQPWRQYHGGQQQGLCGRSELWKRIVHRYTSCSILQSRADRSW